MNDGRECNCYDEWDCELLDCRSGRVGGSVVGGSVVRYLFFMV